MITISKTFQGAGKTGDSELSCRLDLVEWESFDVVLSPAQISDLLRCPPEVLQVQALPGGACRLRPRAVVGRLQFGAVDIRILPKYPMPSLLAMLVEVHELARLAPDLAGYDTNPEVVDLLVQIFLSQVERVVRQGLKRTYIQKDEELVAVRGRLDLRRTLDLHLRGKVKAQCRYEDYTLDGPENRILLAALRAITVTRVLPVVRRNIAHRIAAEFVGVRHALPQTTRSRHVEYDRLNLYYCPALQLAQLILQSMGITQDFGLAAADGFLLNMNQLFERFVYRKCQKFLDSERVRVRAQKKFPFDVQRQANIQPDLLIQNQHGRRVVADTKYKIGTKPDSSDLYQMLTYCRVLKISHGILITVGSGDHRQYNVLDGTTTIEVIPVELGGTVADIDASIRQLTDRIMDLLQTA